MISPNFQVRESQNLIVSTQNLGFTSQTATNKILADVVTNLDSTTSLLERFGDNSPSFKFTSKMSELCDDIRSAVNGLYTAQDQLSSCTSNSMQQLDKLIKSANHIMRNIDENRIFLGERGVVTVMNNQMLKPCEISLISLFRLLLTSRD